MDTKINTKAGYWILFFLIGFGACSSDPPPQDHQTDTEKVEINWTWKRTVTNTTNMVYGTAHNKTDQAIQQVDLEFRTQGENGETIQTHIFSIQDLPPNGQKPFTQDFPARFTQEDSGFVTVKKVIAAN